METMQGLKRTDRCGVFRTSDIGRTVCVMGWAQKLRNLGSLLFIDLRDRSGIVQLTFDEQSDAEMRERAASVRAEFVLAAVGTVRRRAGAVNEKLDTGEIEIYVKELRILSAAKTPPFEITDDTNVSADLRLRYRFLDLRRPALQKNLILRSRAAMITRNYFTEQGFIELETPTLMKSTPEGARDYLVPSRVHPGKFYALPQSPQLYKQILMIAGYDRYIQLARCFRDEDLRADRQPEFTQIDMELAFVDVDDIIEVNEGFLKRLFRETLGVEVQTPIRRMTWHDAMENYGSDKPDLRFGFELHNVSDIFAHTEFHVFRGALDAGGSVRAINVKGGASRFPRKELDKLGEFVKSYRAKGVAWAKLGDETSSSFLKFVSEAERDAFFAEMGAEKGDLLLVVADAKNKVVFDSLGALRCECAKRMDLLRKDDYKFLWVTEFPLFEYSEEEGRYMAMHHPFTSPMDEDIPLLDTDQGAVRAKAYDIVLNGVEVGGGSIRIFSPEIQSKMFELLGISPETAQRRFGFLLEALKYGTPPHGGLAYGFDRLMMLISGEDTIRDVIAFPKVQNASEPMSGAPDTVEQKQLDELSIASTKSEE